MPDERSLRRGSPGIILSLQTRILFAMGRRGYLGLCVDHSLQWPDKLDQGRKRGFYEVVLHWRGAAVHP